MTHRAVRACALVVALVGCTRHRMWDCLDGRHVVVSQYCGGLVGCSEAEREETACGDKTPLEKRIGHYLGNDCRAVPEGQRWPGS